MRDSAPKRTFCIYKDIPVAFEVVLMYRMAFSFRALISSLSLPISTGCGLKTSSISLSDEPQPDGPPLSPLSPMRSLLVPSAPDPVDSFSDKLDDSLALFFADGAEEEASLGVGVEGADTLGVVASEELFAPVSPPPPPPVEEGPESGAFFRILVARF